MDHCFLLLDAAKTRGVHVSSELFCGHDERAYWICIYGRPGHLKCPVIAFTGGSRATTARVGLTANGLDLGGSWRVAAKKGEKVRILRVGRRSLAAMARAKKSGARRGSAGRKKKPKRDKCYYKIKARYKVWPSAYASGALVRCRKGH